MPDTINLDIDYFDHPKVRRLIGILGPGSEVHHIRLMTYAAKHRPGSGGFDDWSAEEIESAADWRGEKSKMVEAMIRCGLLHEKNGGYYLHDWKERQPHLVKYEKTKRERKKAAEKRWREERRQKKPFKSNRDNELDEDANDDAKCDLASPENQFCITNAVQGSAVTTNSLSPACVRDGEGGDSPGQEPLVDIPDDLLELARHAIGLTPEALLLGWLRVNKWPADWIAKAILKAKERGKKPKEMPTYVPGILRRWAVNGGPNNEEPEGSNRPHKRPNGGGGGDGRRPGKFAGLDPWANAGGDRGEEGSP